MKKIGIFLGYGPHQLIKNQGIGRLMGFILKGISHHHDARIVIAASRWCKERLIELLQDQKVDLEKIELITTTHLPYLLRIKNFFFKLTLFIFSKNALRKKEVKSLKNIIHWMISIGLNLIISWLSTSSTPLFICFTLLLFSILILITQINLSIILFTILMLSVFFTRHLFSQSYSDLKKRISKKISKLMNPLFMALKNDPFSYAMYEKFRHHEMCKLISRINKRKDITVWLIPCLSWPEIKQIQAKKVVAAADIIFVDFPSLFLTEGHQFTYYNLIKAIEKIDHFICYSNYVKQKQLIASFSLDPDQISVITHGSIDLSNYLNKCPIRKENFYEAKRILKQYQQEKLINNYYLHNYDFNSIRFIFYSSQMRPHKNFLTLIKAYEALLRKRFLNIKLIITADLKHDLDIYHYIQDRKLQFDIISLPNISSVVLAALYQLAICAVNPSLFEGGFPFTFTEAYSVGTPSIMSHIPVVIDEVKEAELQKIMLFDPYNFEDLAHKVEWAIHHPEKLYTMQAPLYEKLKQRTWDTVANEYIDLLSNIAHG